MAHLSSSVFTSVGCLKNCSHHMEFSEGEGEISSCQQVESEQIPLLSKLSRMFAHDQTGTCQERGYRECATEQERKVGGSFFRLGSVTEATELQGISRRRPGDG